MVALARDKRKKKSRCKRCLRFLSSGSSQSSKQQLCGVCVHELYPEMVRHGQDISLRIKEAMKRA